MNKETFKQTYLPLSASMYRTAYRILGNPEDPEEDGILVLLKGEFNIKDIHKIIKHDTFK